MSIGDTLIQEGMMKTKEFIGIRLDPEEVKKLDAIAEADDRSRAYVVRVLILEALEAREAKRVPA